jgi:hypothetical protein
VEMKRIFLTETTTQSSRLGVTLSCRLTPVELSTTKHREA